MDDEKLIGVLTKLESSIARLEQSVAKLEQGQAKLEQGQANTTASITELRTVMMSRFERIEDRLTSMAEDITVNMGASGTALDRMQSSRREIDALTEMVTTMQRQMMRLRTDIVELQKKAS